MTQPCLVHRYGEPDLQGYVCCSVCGDSFNLADDAADDEEYNHYVDFADGEDSFDRCADCDGHDACADFGCAFGMGLGHLVQTDIP